MMLGIIQCRIAWPLIGLPFSVLSSICFLHPMVGYIAGMRIDVDALSFHKHYSTTMV